MTRLFLAFLALGALMTSGCFLHQKRCGPSSCGEGEGCCNRGCGICTAPDGACIDLFCSWGKPVAIPADNAPSRDVYDRASAGTSLARTRLEGGPKMTIAMAHAGVQRYLAPWSALRLRLTGATPLSSDGLLDPGSGFAASIGATKTLKKWHTPLMSWFVPALNFDAEYKDGVVPARTISPTSIAEARTLTAAAGVAIEDVRNVVPLEAHARYLFSDADGRDSASLVDLGLGFSGDTSRFYLKVPVGARVSYRYIDELGGDYRDHELSTGFYYTMRKLRAGVDGAIHFSRYGTDTHARTLDLLLRVEYYWDSNN